mgnify:CR=1 FL=1
MLLKLALRNVRRQIGGYLIYFVTVALTVSLLFSLASLMFSETVLNISASFKAETAAVCAFLSAVLTVVSALVLGYGCAFLLRRRKREFGMYLTLGMTRGNIIALFTGEMFFTFLFSLAAGLGLGTLVYQAIAAGISSFLELEFTWADYSVWAFVLTIVLVGVVFLLTSLVSLAYLRFEKIAVLLQGENKLEKPVKNARLWLRVMLVSFVALVLSLIAIAVSSVRRPDVFVIIVGAAVAFPAIVLTYVGALKGGTYYLLENKKFSGKGTRTFTLRQLSGRMSADSAFLGVIAVLLSVVVAGGNLFLTMFGTQVVGERLYNPFTVSVRCPFDRTGELTDDLPLWMEEFGTVEESHLFTIFELEDHSICRYLGGFSANQDCVMRESDYLALSAMAGEKATPVNGGYVILCNDMSVYEQDEVKRAGFENFSFVCAGESLSFTAVASGRSALAVGMSNRYFVVVPDRVADALEASGEYWSASTRCAVNYEGDVFDEEGMNRFFWEKNEEDAYREFMQVYYNDSFFSINVANSFYSALVQMAAPWLMILLFVTLAFALLSMAVLALKSLAAVAEDKRRYRLLYLAGASEGQTPCLPHRADRPLLPLALRRADFAECARVLRLRRAEPRDGRRAYQFTDRRQCGVFLEHAPSLLRALLRRHLSRGAAGRQAVAARFGHVADRKNHFAVFFVSENQP